MATASEMVEAIERALRDNPLVASVTVDGQSVTYNRSQAMEELAYWKRKAAAEAGKSRLFRGFNVGGSW